VLLSMVKAGKIKLVGSFALKFIRQYEHGEADYSKLRRELYEKDKVSDLLVKME